MRYKNTFILTYGRTGSTLLQGILNSIEGVVVRGENYNLCFGLFQAYLSLKKSMTLPKEDGTKASQPFFGKDKINLQKFLKSSREIVSEQLAIKDDPAIACWGFKEIRYTRSSFSSSWGYPLKAYLDFMSELFPESLFIVLTRDHDAVLKSAFWSDKNYSTAKAEIEQFENEVSDWCKDKNNTFWIDYSDLSLSSENLKLLFSEIGVNLHEEKIASVLGVEHSYGGKKENLKGITTTVFSAESSAEEKYLVWVPSQSETVITSFVDGGGVKFKTGGSVDVGGAVLLGPNIDSQDVNLTLEVGEDVYFGEWGLASPKLAEKFVNNPNSPHSRFKFSKVVPFDDIPGKLFLCFPNGHRELIGMLEIKSKFE